MSVNINAGKETIPAFIQESWKRCHSKGLQPSMMDKENMLGEFELAEFTINTQNSLSFFPHFRRSV